MASNRPKGYLPTSIDDLLDSNGDPKPPWVDLSRPRTEDSEMPDEHEELRAKVKETYEQALSAGGPRDALITATLLEGILYLGAELAETRRLMAEQETVVEERHRDLLAALQPDTTFHGADPARMISEGKTPIIPPEMRVEGETRIDPDDGNAYVRRGEMPTSLGDAADELEFSYVDVTDIMGGHWRTIPKATWESWELADLSGGGTFTVSAGSGVSDPVPYDADQETVQAAFDQAQERSGKAAHELQAEDMPGHKPGLEDQR